MEYINEFIIPRSEYPYTVDGSVTVTFTSGQFEPVHSHVLSCGVNAVPQKPEKLVQAWKDTINTLYSRSTK